MRKPRLLSLRAAGALSFLAFVAGCGQAKESEEIAQTSQALGSADLVISQVYGGGGNSGAKWKQDFVELFNRGTTAVSLNGLSIQYAGGNSTFLTQSTSTSGASVVALPDKTIEPGKYFLVQLDEGTGGTDDLPTPDHTGATEMGGSNGKVALVSGTTALDCGTTAKSCFGDAGAGSVIDLVAYGTAQGFEGTGATPALSNTTAAFRAGSGCTDTDDNKADFTTGAPAPRNSSIAAHSCAADAGTTDGGDDAATEDAGEDTATEDAGEDTIVVIVDSGTEDTAPAEDTAAPEDTSPAEDSAAPEDTSPAEDTAVPEDTSTPTDASDDTAPTDAGDDTAAPTDAGEDTSTTEDTGTEEDTGTTEEDTGTTPADTGTKPPTDSGASDSGADTGDIAPPEAAATDDSGCGCRVAGAGESDATKTGAGLASLVALGAVMARRRRR